MGLLKVQNLERISFGFRKIWRLDNLLLKFPDLCHAIIYSRHNMFIWVLVCLIKYGHFNHTQKNCILVCCLASWEDCLNTNKRSVSQNESMRSSFLPKCKPKDFCPTKQTRIVALFLGDFSLGSFFWLRPFLVW